MSRIVVACCASLTLGQRRRLAEVAATAGEAEIRDTAARDPKVAGWLHGKTIKKVVVIPKRLVNFVVAG